MDEVEIEMAQRARAQENAEEQAAATVELVSAVNGVAQELRELQSLIDTIAGRVVTLLAKIAGADC